MNALTAGARMLAVVVLVIAQDLAEEAVPPSTYVLTPDGIKFAVFYASSPAVSLAAAARHLPSRQQLTLNRVLFRTPEPLLS
jgi:hypothetical protein